MPDRVIRWAGKAKKVKVAEWTAAGVGAATELLGPLAGALTDAGVTGGQVGQVICSLIGMTGYTAPPALCALLGALVMGWLSRAAVGRAAYAVYEPASSLADETHPTVPRPPKRLVRSGTG